jgi:methyl coenzyme M reductase subunit C-like uncharacterized protein (methanogenesis marker protein 7)
MKSSYLLFGLLLLTLISCNDNDDIVTTDLYPENLVAYYPFNGNSLNEINLENNGLVDGAILTADIGGSLNSAFSFDGIDDIIKINHNSIFNLSNDFTISALIKPEEIKTQHIVRKGASVNGTGRRPYGISLSATGDIVFSVTTENGQILNQARKQGYQINEWYLITGVFKDSEMLLYVNGELEVSEITNGQITTNTEPLLIGSRLSLPSDTFKGAIDEVRIYNVGLNEFEVREIYNNL